MKTAENCEVNDNYFATCRNLMDGNFIGQTRVNLASTIKACVLQFFLSHLPAIVAGDEISWDAVGSGPPSITNESRVSKSVPKERKLISIWTGLNFHKYYTQNKHKAIKTTMSSTLSAVKRQHKSSKNENRW